MTVKAEVKSITAEPLESKAYAPFGAVVSAQADTAATSANMGTAKRFNKLGRLENLRPAAAPNLCVFRSSPFQDPSFEIRLVERHLHSTQLFIPMACEKRYLVVVCSGADKPDLATLRAFIARKDQGITYHPGVWHHPLIALDQVTDFACVVWEDDSADDCEVHKLESYIAVDLT
ncbi:MAG: ureidoglycolate lyase [Deltaproteobacteria bacterium]|nr:ureidoglycolate lyase [Deltaproteobacteria bacterium]